MTTAPKSQSRAHRLLALATYPVTGAATRYRAVGYFDALADQGIEAELVSFYSEQEFAHLYAGGLLHNAESTSHGVMRVLRAALSRRSYDAVLVQREAAPIGGPYVEQLLQARGIPLIFDFDDAIWLTQHEKSRHPTLARWLRPEKATTLMARASHVIAGSRALGDKARELNDRVTVLPTSVPAARWRPSRTLGSLQGDTPVVGWVGTHSTAPQLEVAFRALEELAREGLRFRLRIVGAGDKVPATSLDTERLPWRLDSEVEDFQQLDIGLGPMQDDEWSAGKCGFKQIQYMATGVPMVSSPVGGARELLQDDTDALFAVTVGDWVRQLRRLLTDAPLRARLATHAHEKFSRELSLEAQAPTFVKVVAGVMRRD